MANSLAHILATETLKNKKEINLVGSVPESAEKQEERDRAGEPH